MACFTHYWLGSTCAFMSESEGDPLIHTSGNQFLKRGVTHGDKIYVVNVHKGLLYLIGRMHVDRIVSRIEAERILGEGDLWEAEEHVLAIKGQATPMRFSRKVPLSVTKELLFEAGSSYTHLKFEGEGLLDRQTLRGVRRLTDASGLELDKMLP